MIDRQSYNQPHEKKKAEINKNRLFFLIFCDYNYPFFKSNKKYHACYFFANKNRKSETIPTKS